MKEQVYIWVDDIRPLDPLRVPRYAKQAVETKSYKQAIKALEEAIAAHKWIIIDLDHDLGEGKNGYDIAKWIVASGYKSLSFRTHSMNPVGVKNIRETFLYNGYYERGSEWIERFEKVGAEGIDFVPLFFNKNCPQNFEIYKSYTKKQMCEEVTYWPRTNYVFWVMRDGKKVYI